VTKAPVPRPERKVLSLNAQLTLWLRRAPILPEPVRRFLLLLSLIAIEHARYSAVQEQMKIPFQDLSKMPTAKVRKLLTGKVHLQLPEMGMAEFMVEMADKPKTLMIVKTSLVPDRPFWIVKKTLSK